MNYTARQAYNVSSQIITNSEAVYSHICYTCMESIKRYSEFHFSHCPFTIPTYLVGFAVFDPIKVKHRLKKHLRSLEYKVKTDNESKNKLSIIVSWSHISNTVLNNHFLTA